jgi:diguanylate cyclase (GGDEF)-like protein
MASLHTSKTETASGTAERASLLTAARLQRAVLKLAFSFYGHSQDLDDRLKRLGNLIKAGRKDGIVQSLIDEVVDLIVARESAAGTQDSIGKQFGDLVGRLNFEHQMADEARAIQRRFADSRSRDELDHHINDLVSLMNGVARRAFAPTHHGDDVREDLLFDSFLAELQLPTDLEQAMVSVRQRIRHRRNHLALLDCARDVARLLSERLHQTPQSHNAAPSAASAISLARAQLHALLEQLPLPSPLSRETGRIKAQLDAATTERDIEAVVAAILDLLAQAGGRSRKDIEELTDFLKVVTRRIEEFKAQVAKGCEAYEESIGNATVFQQLMSSQVAVMRGKVDEETDIDNLKLIMMKQLESLEASVQSFVQVEQSRQSETRSQFDVMLVRLNELEGETQRLRADLDEQHMLSLLDPLTSVFNRMGYIEGIGREFARWKRYGGELALLIFDFDFFKSINDSYGHAAGDKVLASVAALLRKQIRQCDVLCRLGGEEFAIILPATNVYGAAAIADKLRASIASSQFRFKDQPVPVTVSIGAAEFRGADTQEDVFERADRALYVAKKGGRNRCCTELELDDTASATVTVIEPGDAIVGGAG